MEDGGGRGLTSRQIADEFLAQIEAGELKPGDQLPTIRVMMDEFGVSTHTAQRALRHLQESGLVEAGVGRGAFVRKRPEMVERSADYTRPRGAGDPSAYKDRTRLTEVGPVVAPAFVTELLGGKPGDVVIARRRTMLRGKGKTQEPVELVTSFYPAKIAQETALARHEPLQGGSPSELARLGFPPGPATEWVYARMPTPDEARSLNLRAGVPVFRLVRQVRTGEGVPIEVLEMVMSAERYVMRYEL